MTGYLGRPTESVPSIGTKAWVTPVLVSNVSSVIESEQGAFDPLVLVSDTTPRTTVRPDAAVVEYGSA